VVFLKFRVEQYPFNFFNLAERLQYELMIFSGIKNASVIGLGKMATDAFLFI